MVIIFFIFLTWGIGPGVRLILAVAAPRSDALARGGACFVGWYPNKAGLSVGCLSLLMGSGTSRDEMEDPDEGMGCLV